MRFGHDINAILAGETHVWPEVGFRRSMKYSGLTHTEMPRRSRGSMDSAFASTADGVDICLHRLRVDGPLLRSDPLQPLQVVDAEQTVIPEDVPCYLLFPTTVDLPVGAPQQAWERLGEGKTVTTRKGASW